MRLLKLSSVRTRLTLWSVGILALALIVFGVALRSIVQVNLNAAINRGLAQQAHDHQEMTARQFEPHSDGFGPGPPGPRPRPRPGPPLNGHGDNHGDNHGERHGDGPPAGGPGPDFQGHSPGIPPHALKPPRPSTFGQAGALTARVLDLHELPLTGWSAGMPWDTETFPLSVRGQEVYSTVHIGSQSMRVFSMPIRLHDGRIVGVVQTVASLTEENAELAHLTRAFLMLIPLILLIAGVGGAFLTGGTLRPIRSITQAANRISAESLSGRLTVSGDDEFSELATTFNGMLARLDNAFRKLTVAYEQERRFTADASHELRTPLTIIKAHTSLALDSQPTPEEYRESMEAIDLAVDRTNRLVQSLLLLARSDAGRLPLCLSPVSLAEIGKRAAHATQEPAGPAFCLCIPDDGATIEGDSDALFQVFTNLLANAVRHTPADGEVTLTAQGNEAEVIVTVADTGEGIAAEHLPHLFERFYRVESSRARGKGGTGLGLAICREIVLAHHGSLAVESTVGQGTVVRATLPRLQPAEGNILQKMHDHAKNT